LWCGGRTQSGCARPRARRRAAPRPHNRPAPLSRRAQFFTVTISTVGENLAMLMNTVMLTGYMFKSAEERLRLRSALGGGSGDALAAAPPQHQRPPAQAQAQQQQLQQQQHGTSSRGASSSGSGSGASSSGSGSGGGGSSMSSVLDEEEYAPGVQKSRVQVGGAGRVVWGCGSAGPRRSCRIAPCHPRPARRRAPNHPNPPLPPPQGEVLFWHRERGVETMDAVAYIELLEAEVARLRTAAAPPPKPPRLPPAAAWGLEPPPEPAPAKAAASAPEGRQLPAVYDPQRRHSELAVRPHEDRNELLEFIRSLEPSTVGDLTSCATPETAAAMDAFVERLLGLGGSGADRDALRRVASETTATEMRQLLFWLMVMGWKLRAMEVAMELESAQ
jgi:hypothetical protein